MSTVSVVLPRSAGYLGAVPGSAGFELCTLAPAQWSAKVKDTSVVFPANAEASPEAHIQLLEAFYLRSSSLLLISLGCDQL